MLFPHGHKSRKNILFSVGKFLKAAGDKLIMNKFIRQNFGGGLTLNLERLGADSVET